MKKEKGFTLVELLAVIVIIAVIAAIVFPVVTKHIRTSKEKALAVQISEIIRAAKDWAIDNPDSLDKYHINPTYVSIHDLQTSQKANGETYLSAGVVKNPKTGEKMEGTVIITYDPEYSQYVYEYKDIAKSELSKDMIEAAAHTILEKVEPTTSSKTEGLYDDGTQNKYIYQGKAPHNYINIDGSLWRIISIDKETLQIKVIKTSHGTKNPWVGTTTPTAYTFGNNGLSIYDYLNTTYYESLDEIKKIISSNATWNNGEVSNQNQALTAAHSLSKGATVNANIGLLSVNEYLDAVTEEGTACRKNFKDEACKMNNYLAFSTGYWLINTVSGSNDIWTSSTDGLKVTSPTSTDMIAMPVITLKASVSLKESTGTGEIGSSNNPFMLDVS